MKKSRWITAALAAMLALSLTACGSGKKPVETKESVQASQETTAAAVKETETTAKETEPPETEAKIPENAEEITLTNQKLQIQAKFYLPKQAEAWSVENRNGKDPVTPVQKSVYKAKHNEDTTLHVTIQLSATTSESLQKQMDSKEKITIQDYPGTFEAGSTSWDYQIDFGKYADGLETYMLVKFWTGDDSYAQKPGLKEARDLFLDTVTVVTDYEGKEDRSGRKYMGIPMCSLPESFDYNGVNAEVTRPTDSYCVYQLRSEIHETDEIPVRLVGLMTSTINQATYEVTEGYSDYTIAGYPAHIKQTKYVAYLGSEVRFQVGENYYRAFAYTYVDDSDLDVKALAEASKTLNENEAVYFQKSLDFLDVMIQNAEFTDPDEAWFQ
ncbi:MAG: hypothetical protein PUC28_12150 [Blautia sp.]|nr:hypothetical protein [Blautia sp.]